MTCLKALCTFTSLVSIVAASETELAPTADGKASSLLGALSADGSCSGSDDNACALNAVQTRSKNADRKRSGAMLAGFGGGEPNPPEWPGSVSVFTPDMDMADIQATVERAYDTNGRNNFSKTLKQHGDPLGQWSLKNFAFLFKPGTYNVSVPVGYYTQVLGIGPAPHDVVFTGKATAYPGEPTGVFVTCNYTCPSPGSLDTFWRSAENFKNAGNSYWAVSQAAPLRKVHIAGNLSLTYITPDGKPCWASGGFLANSIVDGDVFGGGQQQWITRNSQMNDLKGVQWNNVLVGSKFYNPSCNLRTGTCGVNGNAPGGQTVLVDKTPLIAEKPFISVDPNHASKYVLNVPKAKKDTVGVDWGWGDTYNFDSVYVTQLSDSASKINQKLLQGLHVVVSPGIYRLSEPLVLSHANQVLLCIGMAELHAAAGTPAIVVDSKDKSSFGGVRISGCLVGAGTVKSPQLVQWLPGSSSASNPGFMHDMIVRVGGRTNDAAATTMVAVEADNVVGDNLWLWRADHYLNPDWPFDGNYWDAKMSLGESPSDHGLVVTGSDVTMYGLFVEHNIKDQVVWDGEKGSVYFFQCELPYDVTPEYGDEGYVAYKVGENVKAHSAFGLGVYTYFRDFNVSVKTAISTPPHIESSIHQPMIVYLSGVAGSGLRSIINGKGPGAIHYQKQFWNNSCSTECLSTEVYNQTA